MTPETQRAADVSDDPELFYMNEKWFVLDEGGRLSVVRSVRDEALGRACLVRYSFSDFKRKLEPYVHKASGKQLAEKWLSWEKRRQYDRVVFRPHEGREEAAREVKTLTPHDVLNLWGGFSVQPKPGLSDRIQEHLRDVVCAGDLEHFDYLFKWMARLVQFPGKPGEVAVVLRGKEAVGKSVVGWMLRRIFGQHALAVSSPKYVTGDFNSHLADVVFLECSEALFAGDRQTASKLKAMITDDTLIIERKGSDAVSWPNALSVFMTSNEDWVVPAGPESRRYFVLDVSDERRGDTAYFDALVSEIKDDNALGAFLYDLLTIDLSGFKHRNVPVTDALQDQRARSQTGVLAWALDLAGRGVLQTRNGSQHWRQFFTTRELYEDFEEWRTSKPRERDLSCETFGRELKKTVGLFWQRRARVGQGAPERARDVPGYEMPKTVAAFDRIVRERAGLLEDEDPLGITPVQEEEAA
jgi:hypothetical protein